MTVALEAPVLAGSRPRAQQLVADLPEDLAGKGVRLHCNLLVAATASFADELVRDILVDRHAEMLIVSGISDDEFEHYLRERAAAHGVADRLKILT